MKYYNQNIISIFKELLYTSKSRYLSKYKKLILLFNKYYSKKNIINLLEEFLSIKIKNINSLITKKSILKKYKNKKLSNKLIKKKKYYIYF